MKKCVALLAVPAVMLLSGCASDTAVTGPDGEVLGVKPPTEVLEVRRGEQAAFSLELSHVKLSLPITFEFKNLPKGITIEGGMERPAGTANAAFAVVVDDDAEITTHALTVIATSGAMSKDALIQVRVVESLAKREQERTKVVDELQATFDTTETMRKELGKRSFEAARDKQKELIETNAKLLDQSHEVEKALAELKAMPLDQWKAAKEKTAQAVTDYKSAVEAQSKKVDGLVDKKPGDK